MGDENKNQNDEFDYYQSSNNHNNQDDSLGIRISDDNDDDDNDEDITSEDGLVFDDDYSKEEIDITDEIDENETEDEDDKEEAEQEEEDEEGMDYDEEEVEDDSIEEESNETITINKNKIIIAKRLLENIAENNEKLISLFGGMLSSEDEERINISQISEDISDEEGDGLGKVIEGVFDGENMIGPDGKQYTVPSNYASKSKLVEGDMLKLTITEKGTFVYKQTKPVERDRIVGTVKKGEDGSFFVVSGGKRWKVLTASITYYKGNYGDEAIILVPKGSDSNWGAVENVIKKASSLR